MNDLKNAIQDWKKRLYLLDGNKTRYASSQRTECNLAIKALSLEIDTGKPHCMCHLLPHDKCPSIISET